MRLHLGLGIYATVFQERTPIQVGPAFGKVLSAEPAVRW